jgi:hypothetical protein
MILLPFTTLAQSKHVELTPFGGYLLGGSVKFIQGKFKLVDNAGHGGMLSHMIHDGYHVEFSYTPKDRKESKERKVLSLPYYIAFFAFFAIFARYHHFPFQKINTFAFPYFNRFFRYDLSF